MASKRRRRESVPCLLFVSRRGGFLLDKLRSRLNPHLRIDVLSMADFSAPRQAGAKLAGSRAFTFFGVHAVNIPLSFAARIFRRKTIFAVNSLPQFLQDNEYSMLGGILRRLAARLHFASADLVVSFSAEITLRLRDFLGHESVPILTVPSSASPPLPFPGKSSRGQPQGVSAILDLTPKSAASSGTCFLIELAKLMPETPFYIVGVHASGCSDFLLSLPTNCLALEPRHRRWVMDDTAVQVHLWPDELSCDGLAEAVEAGRSLMILDRSPGLGFARESDLVVTDDSSAAAAAESIGKAILSHASAARSKIVRPESRRSKVEDDPLLQAVLCLTDLGHQTKTKGRLFNSKT